MASPLPLYFSLLLLLTAAIVSSAARNAPATAGKERNGGMVAMNEGFGEPRAEDYNTVHRLLAGHEEIIGVQDYGDARANHKHDPHHPLPVHGNKKELDG